MSAPEGDRPRLSIVTTLYRSEAVIDEFLARVRSAAVDQVGEDYEVVVVNDGSPDRSVDRVLDAARADRHLVVVDLSRNFGHHPALLEGMRQSQGELVFLIDSDLEEQPEWLPMFAEMIALPDTDVVYGFQETRKGGKFERATGRLYWTAFRSLTKLDIPANIVTCRLMTRRYVDAVLAFPEREVSIGGIFALTGFKQVAVAVPKESRGATTYSLRLKLWHTINSITSFSNRPLDMIFVLGMLVLTTGLIITAYLVIAALFWGKSPAGWSSVMASVWLLGGLTLMSAGVIATYLGKVFLEVKARPRGVVRAVHRRPQTTESEQIMSAPVEDDPPDDEPPTDPTEST